VFKTAIVLVFDEVSFLEREGIAKIIYLYAAKPPYFTTSTRIGDNLPPLIDPLSEEDNLPPLIDPLSEEEVEGTNR
jgi:hypothetical protein